MTEYERQQKEIKKSNDAHAAFGGGILKLLFIGIPLLFAKILGFIVGLVLKMGIVGRTLTAALAAFGVFVVLIIVTSAMGINNNNGIINALLLIPSILVGVWFWVQHYHTVKQMSFAVFVDLTTLCFSICFYGTIALAITGYLLLKWPGNMAFGAGMGISLLIAVAVWLLKSRDYSSETGEETDFASVLKAAENGDPQAQLSIAGAYFDGDHVVQDKKKGLEWYQKAAQNGNPVAQYNLGILYYDGDGTPVDKKKSFEWYKKAAENGHAEAQYCIYMAYADPEPEYGISQNIPKAREWLEKSAEQGFEPAQEDLEELG